MANPEMFECETFKEGMEWICQQVSDASSIIERRWKTSRSEEDFAKYCHGSAFYPDMPGLECMVWHVGPGERALWYLVEEFAFLWYSCAGKFKFFLWKKKKSGNTEISWRNVARRAAERRFKILADFAT